jgi:four helix bundle protein
MTAKLHIVHEEADEVVYWMEVAVDAGMLPKELVAPLMDEANQITAMIVSSLKTLRGESPNRP